MRQLMMTSFRQQSCKMMRRQGRSFQSSLLKIEQVCCLVVDGWHWHSTCVLHGVSLCNTHCACCIFHFQLKLFRFTLVVANPPVMAWKTSEPSKHSTWEPPITVWFWIFFTYYQFHTAYIFSGLCIHDFFQCARKMRKLGRKKSQVKNPQYPKNIYMQKN